LGRRSPHSAADEAIVWFLGVHRNKLRPLRLPWERKPKQLRVAEQRLSIRFAAPTLWSNGASAASSRVSVTSAVFAALLDILPSLINSPPSSENTVSRMVMILRISIMVSSLPMVR
jgi:hypothetical protein